MIKMPMNTPATCTYSIVLQMLYTKSLWEVTRFPFRNGQKIRGPMIPHDGRTSSGTCTHCDPVRHTWIRSKSMKSTARSISSSEIPTEIDGSRMIAVCWNSTTANATGSIRSSVQNSPCNPRPESGVTCHSPGVRWPTRSSAVRPRRHSGQRAVRRPAAALRSVTQSCPQRSKPMRSRPSPAVPNTDQRRSHQSRMWVSNQVPAMGMVK